jgi:hypothetical protein
MTVSPRTTGPPSRSRSVRKVMARSSLRSAAVLTCPVPPNANSESLHRSAAEPLRNPLRGLDDFRHPSWNRVLIAVEILTPLNLLEGEVCEGVLMHSMARTWPNPVGITKPIFGLNRQIGPHRNCFETRPRKNPPNATFQARLPPSPESRQQYRKGRSLAA